MRYKGLCCSLMAVGLLAHAWDARAQGQKDEPAGWAIDFGVGLQPSVNGNVNSGAIGTLHGLATAILPQSYGEVYGTGLDLRFGAGYALNPLSELHGMFIYQSSDADLVRLGDIGPSSLYGQYSDYKSFALDFGYRRYLPLETHTIRVYGEGTLGLGFIDRVNVQLAAPQANTIFDSTDFYDRTAAFTLGINAGILVQISEHVDFNAQVGLRRTSALSEVDQLVGTGLEGINNDTGRLTFPIVFGVRYRLK